MIKINSNSKIYIVCPAYVKTGGPELLHQLADLLKKNGLDSKIIYVNTSNDNKNYTSKDFERYDIEYGFEEDVIDDENNLLILPEIYIDKVNKYKNIRVAIWWLSVDNYLKNYTFKKSKELFGIKTALKLLLNGTILFHKNDYKKADYHLCQSYYSIDFLEKRGIKNVEYLSDYINDSYLNIKPNKKIKKKDVVLYNPKKGIKFTKKIIEKAKDIEFVPIQNLTTEQVKELLLKSKVYIDFGNHPGKDRFPREAAMCGCCVITGRRGSANFHEDVPILDDFKFDDKDESIDLIIARIKKCFKNYDKEIIKFEDYRLFISGEKKKFQEDVRNIFVNKKEK